MIYDILGYIMLLVVLLSFSLFLFREIQARRADQLILALKDFIIAIDDAEPEEILGAYIGAAEVLEAYPES